MQSVLGQNYPLSVARIVAAWGGVLLRALHDSRTQTAAREIHRYKRLADGEGSTFKDELLRTLA